MMNDKHFLEESEEQQNRINERDLREIAHYYGGWNELIKVIGQIRDNENSNQESVPSDWWSGGFAENH